MPSIQYMMWQKAAKIIYDFVFIAKTKTAEQTDPENVICYSIQF